MPIAKKFTMIIGINHARSVEVQIDHLTFDSDTGSEDLDASRISIGGGFNKLSRVPTASHFPPNLWKKHGIILDSRSKTPKITVTDTE